MSRIGNAIKRHLNNKCKQLKNKTYAQQLYISFATGQLNLEQFYAEFEKAEKNEQLANHNQVDCAGLCYTFMICFYK